MSDVKSFRDLEVWQKAMDFAEHVYRVQRAFPDTEQYGLADQLRRAVVSIPSNIAEGHARNTTKEFIRFLTMAQGSLNEAMTQLELASRFGFLPKGTGLYKEATHIAKMLAALVKSLVRKSEPPTPNP